MKGFREEAAAFQREKQEIVARAGQTAALFLIAGIDLADAMAADRAGKARIAARLERLIERERQRGIRKHWAYDLNRHIALKQALDRLQVRPAESKNGAAGRRCRNRHDARRLAEIEPRAPSSREKSGGFA